MQGRLGGAEAREAAADYFEDPNLETRKTYQRICLPLYNPGPADPDASTRVVQHTKSASIFGSMNFPDSICHTRQAAFVVPL